MRQNYKGNKKRIEETKRKRKEEKKNRRLLNKNAESPVPPEGTAPEVLPEAAV